MQISHLEYHRDAERDHWWFAARRSIVLAQLESALEPRRTFRRETLRILDIGCGAGGMLSFLSNWGEVAGVDASPEAVAMAAATGVGDVRHGSLPGDIPFDPASFDVITLLDVLEHVDDDVMALEAVRRLLRPHGTLIMTVPAYRLLWSGHDVVNEHRRRYVRGELRHKLQEAGFTVDRLSYFNTLLFPPIALARFLGRLRRGTPTADTGRVPAPLNAMLRSIFGVERHLLGATNLPFGVSLLAVARAPGTTQ